MKIVEMIDILAGIKDMYGNIDVSIYEHSINNPEGWYSDFDGSDIRVLQDDCEENFVEISIYPDNKPSIDSSAREAVPNYLSFPHALGWLNRIGGR